MAVVALAIEGFCRVDVNPLGPVQLYVAPGKLVAVKSMLPPAQTGVLLPATIPGIGLIVTSTESGSLELQPATLAVTM